jgi:hypothetical protein
MLRANSAAVAARSLPELAESAGCGRLRSVVELAGLAGSGRCSVVTPGLSSTQVQEHDMSLVNIKL